MNVGIFNKLYWVRRFGPQKNVKGYLVSSHEDFVASLNVSPSEQRYHASPSRRPKKTQRSTVHGVVELRVADEKLSQKGDLLYYYDAALDCFLAALGPHDPVTHKLSVCPCSF